HALGGRGPKRGVHGQKSGGRSGRGGGSNKLSSVHRSIRHGTGSFHKPIPTANSAAGGVSVGGPVAFLHSEHGGIYQQNAHTRMPVVTFSRELLELADEACAK
ncbi:MAG: hypothetical protein WCL11_02430, partial [Verrucomicrobiota bacterium]